MSTRATKTKRPTAQAAFAPAAAASQTQANSIAALSSSLAKDSATSTTGLPGKLTHAPGTASASSSTDLTPLQKHVGFWDRNNDGIIYPWETYEGFTALGFNPIIAAQSAFAFHLLHVGYSTQSSWIPNPLMPVTIANIHWAKHGSDSGSYDKRGAFVRERFDAIFLEFDRDGKDGLTFREITHMWRGNRNVYDVIGWSFQFFLWTFLWCLAADRDGVLHKEDVHRQYDGSLYYDLEARRRSGEKLPWFRGGTGLGWSNRTVAGSGASNLKVHKAN
ncbi:hypothetical protein HKX48_008461 [Thoreauomyces humboldtii]|nr:hypothetical protein HKX48_008461 [Thoreauomyces humboldtii]